MIFYINRECRYLHSEGIESHIGLANLIVENSPYLKELFKKSGEKYPDDFLLYNMGYIKAKTTEYYNECVYYSRIMNETQLGVLERLAASGYTMIDVTQSVIDRLKDNEPDKK